jgi:RNA polymerase sigma factor (sigma-70 family)
MGSREAFAALVGHYQGLVSATTLSIIGDFKQSEDIAQETFLIAWNQLSELSDPAKFPAWLCGIARNCSKKWLRRQVRNPLTHSAELIDVADKPDTAIEPLSKADAQLVWRSLADIPETYREPMLMFYRHGAKIAEIADALELTEEAVRQRLSRGRKMLKAEVEKQVESVLETTRPDTAFTMAVLASLPLVAATTTTGCSVAGTGTASHAGWFGWWTPLLYLFAPIILVTGGFMGLWTALKHSPTIRTRRFMCRTALQWYVFIWVFMLTKLYVDDKHGAWNAHGNVYFFASYFLIIIVVCFWLVYRWRRLLEEDAGLCPPLDKSLEKTSLSLFYLRCWYWVSLLPILVFSLLFTIDLHREFGRGLDPASLSSVVIPLALCLLWMSIPIGFFIVVGYGIRTSRDENSLHRWYPRDGKAFLPKYEERTRWLFFWFDLVVMYSVTIVPLISLITSNHMADGVAAWVLLSTMLMTVTTLIASHSAGIPGKRLRGYAKLCLFLGLCHVIFSLSLTVFIVLVYFGVALLAFVLSRRKRS